MADYFVIRLYDVVALRMLWKFEGHTDHVTGMDGSLRIWDVIIARQIDALHADVSITALSLSPNMDVLATTHVDQNGVYLCKFSLYSVRFSVPEYLM